MSLSFSPNGSMIAVGFAEGTARILSYPDLEVLVSPMRTGRFTCLRWAASGAQPGMDRVAGAGSSDGSVPAWEVWGKLSYYLELKGHSRQVTDLSWSPDGSMLATCSLDGDVRLWHMVQRDILGIIRSVGGLLETLPSGNELASVDWAPDGSAIASSKSGALYRWSPSTRQTLRMRNHTSQILDVAWSPTSKEIAFNLGWEDLGIYHLDSGTLDTWSLGVEPFGSIMSIDWSGDGTKVAVGDASSIRILASGGEILASTPQKGGVRCVEWSPDSGYLASTAMDASIRIWDGYTGNLLATLTGHSTYIPALSWSPDGKWLASSDLGGWVILWEMPRGEIVKRFRPVGDRVQWISWSPGVNLIAVLGMDTRVGSIALSVLDLEGNAVWSTPLAGGVSQVAWSPTGTYLAFSSGRDCVSVLTSTGLFVCNVTPASWGEVVEWSMDGRFVASGGYDGILKIYDAELIGQIPEITEAVACLAFLLLLVSAERKTRPATGPNNQPSPSYTWPSARGAQQSSERLGSATSQDRRAKVGCAASVCSAPFREEGWGSRCTRRTAGTR